MKKTFFDFFPTPKFITMPSSGLLLADENIFFVNLVRGKKGELLLKEYGREQIPGMIIQNGDIKNPKEIVELLTAFRKKYDISFIKTSLPDEKSFLFRTTIPKMSLSEIREALQFKIEENVPLLANEAIFDFQVLPWEDPEAKEIQVVVSVISEEVVFNYLNILRESGFKPMMFEIESQSVARAVVKGGDMRPYIIVNAGAGKVGLYIVDRGLVQFTSNLNLGKDFFSSLTFSQKEGGNIKYGDGQGVVYTKAADTERILKDEIDKLLAYWSSFNPTSKAKIEKIILCGEGALDPNIKNYFKTYFSFPLELANVWTNAFSLDRITPDLTFEESFKYAAAIGLALPHNTH